MKNKKKMKKENNINNNMQEGKALNQLNLRKEQMLEKLSLAVNGLSGKEEITLKNYNKLKK